MGGKQVDLSEFERLENLPKTRQPPCVVPRFREQVKPGERDSFDAALARPRTVISSKAICRWLVARGILEDADKSSILRVTAHRQGSCSCAKELALRG
jgi:hypothetical protein